MGLIKQTASQYYDGQVNYTPAAANNTNVLTWPNTMTPLIWDATATQTSIDNYKVFVDNVEQTIETSPYFLTRSLSTTIVNGVSTQQLTLTSTPEVTAINQTVTGAGYQIGSISQTTGGSGTGLSILINNTNGNGTIYEAGSGYTNGNVVTLTSGNGGAKVAVTVTQTAIPAGSDITIKLNNPSLWDNYKSYQYTSLIDIVNNFMVAYVGTDKIVPRVKRSDVIFHAKRGLQEFSYDYVNYVQLSYIDDAGIKHIIYPTTLTSNPQQVPLQDDQGIPTQDIYGNNIQAVQSLTNSRWRAEDQDLLNGQFNLDAQSNPGVYNWAWWKMAYGQRYGLNPETTQTNGWFTIDERRGVFAFSSNLANKLIILEYISDGLAYDEDTKIPKLAEEALYMYILYNIIAVRSNFPEYVVQRYKREKSAKLRNAKIRLSNIKLEEFTQVMRGKSKWIKF